MRVAAIDCGTNSVRLLIAEATGDGHLHEIDRRLELTRLGQGVDFTGQFHPDALQRTFAAIDGYAQAIAEVGGVDKIRMVATSAARDAGNREEFMAGVHKRLGIFPEVIAGEEEAALSFTGALTGANQVTDPVLVTDIGGGSTELVLGANGQMQYAKSLNMGSVRLRERFLHSDPVTPEQLEAASAFVDGMLDASGVDFASVGTLIGVAGTMTALSAAIQQLPAYERERVHGSVLTSQQLDSMLEKMATWSVDELMQHCPSLPKQRAEVIAGGAVIAAQISQRVGVPAIICETDILDGVALGLIYG